MKDTLMGHVDRAEYVQLSTRPCLGHHRLTISFQVGPLSPSSFHLVGQPLPSVQGVRRTEHAPGWATRLSSSSDRQLATRRPARSSCDRATRSSWLVKADKHITVSCLTWHQMGIEAEIALLQASRGSWRVHCPRIFSRTKRTARLDVL